MSAFSQPVPKTQDLALPNAPSDGVSHISFSPNGQLVVCSSWDKGVRCWELQRGYNNALQATPKAQMNHDGPAFWTDFSADGSTVFSGGADKQVKMWNLGQPGSQGQQIGQHDGPVKSLKFIPEMNLVASASWDRTVKFWDARQPTPAAGVTLSERCYAMDIRGGAMVVATADRKMSVFNMGAWSNGPTPQHCEDSPLRYQTRCVAVFPDQTGFAVGSIEGRVGIEYFAEMGKFKNTYSSRQSFAFKCHRTQPKASVTNVYSVNAIAFHKYGTFATAGADGNFHFWDKDSRQRLKAFDLQLNNTIPCCTFSPGGELFGYAASYDWSMGVEQASPAATHNVYVHVVADEEVKPRPKDKK